jgi:hypothetical protein
VRCRRKRGETGPGHSEDCSKATGASIGSLVLAKCSIITTAQRDEGFGRVVGYHALACAGAHTFTGPADSLDGTQLQASGGSLLSGESSPE